jgi:predicted Zn-dependent protease
LKHLSSRIRILTALSLLALCLSWVGSSVAEPGDRSDWENVFGHINKAKVAFSLTNAKRKITREDEYYVGRVVAAQILSKYQPYENPEATRYVNLVGHSLALSSKRPEVFRGYRFILLDSDEVNAFACPDAFIFITRGMLSYTQDEDMLAAVLAHEIAHIESHHGRELIKKKLWQKFWKNVATAALGDLSGKTLSTVTTTLGAMGGGYFETLYTKGYEKKLDLEADQAAVELLQRTGYDPHALLEVLAAITETDAPNHRRWFKTHPKTKTRLKKLIPLAAAAKDRPEIRQQRFRTALHELLEG